MPDYGAINNVYRGALDADAGYGVSPQSLYGYLLGQGANRNEAMLLTSAAASESRLNPGATHDADANGNPTGIGLWGHRLDRRDALVSYAANAGKPATDWQTQAAFALQELRSRPEGRAAANATTPEQLALAQMHYEQPQGFTSSNPEGGHNYTGRLNQIRLYTGLDPSATGAFAPSANPQVTSQQVASATPSAGAGAAAGAMALGGGIVAGGAIPIPAIGDAQLNADLAKILQQARAQPGGGYRQPLVSQLIGAAARPIHDALSQGLTNLLGGGGSGSSLGATPSSPSALAPVASPFPSGSTAAGIPPVPLSPSAPAVLPDPPLPAPRPADTPAAFAAPGLPAPQQPPAAAIGAAGALPMFAQANSPLAGLAALFGGAGA